MVNYNVLKTGSPCMIALLKEEKLNDWKLVQSKCMGNINPVYK